MEGFGIYFGVKWTRLSDGMGMERNENKRPEYDCKVFGLNMWADGVHSYLTLKPQNPWMCQRVHQ